MKFHEIGISLKFHTICALVAAREVAGPFHEIFEMPEIFAPARRGAPAHVSDITYRSDLPAAASKPLKGTTLSCGTGSLGDQERSFDQYSTRRPSSASTGLRLGLRRHRARVVGVGASTALH